MSIRAGEYQRPNADASRSLVTRRRNAASMNMMHADPTTTCRTSVPPVPWTKKAGIQPACADAVTTATDVRATR